LKKFCLCNLSYQKNKIKIKNKKIKNKKIKNKKLKKERYINEIFLRVNGVSGRGIKGGEGITRKEANAYFGGHKIPCGGRQADGIGVGLRAVDSKGD
jgi:hypothetical protein